MRAANKRMVLAEIRRSGPIARAELARRTALGKPAISGIVDDLLSEGLLREVGLGETKAKGGRPPILVEFDPTAEAYLAIHFGVNTTTVAVADGRGSIVASRSARTRRGDPTAGVRAARNLTRAVLAAGNISPDHVRTGAVAVPGLVNRNTGVLRLAPNLGWHDFPIAEALTDALKVPMTAYNITQAAAIAEARLGAAQAVKSFVWVYVGSGVGAAIVDDGQLVFGSRGFNGEIGHCRVVDRGPRCACGKIGCLEVLASGQAIARAGEEAASGRRKTVLQGRSDLTAHDVIDAALAGDAVASNIVAEVGRVLGRGVAYLAGILDPELVVIGGRVALAGDLLLDPVRRVLGRSLLHQASLPVVRSALADRAELAGALLLAMEAAGAPAPSGLT